MSFDEYRYLPFRVRLLLNMPALTETPKHRVSHRGGGPLLSLAVRSWGASGSIFCVRTAGAMSDPTCEHFFVLIRLLAGRGCEQRSTRAALEALPVLALGQADDLYFEDRSRGIRIWLSRDAPHIVEVEQWTPATGWIVMASYPVSD